MESLAAVFGQRLKVLRKRRDLTQEALGRLTKIDYKYLGSLERGERTPSFDAIERIARVLKVEFYELFLTHELDAQLAKSIGGVVRDLERLDRRDVQSFFTDLHAAVRKLDRGAGE